MTQIGSFENMCEPKYFIDNAIFSRRYQFCRAMCPNIWDLAEFDGYIKKCAVNPKYWGVVHEINK
jgi:hypothetical protein